MPPRHALPLLLSTLLLAPGCKVGPDYTPPDTRAPESWSSPLEGGATPGQPEPAALAEWWTTLNDPVLTDLIDRAIRRNLNIRLATARVREARAERGIAAADRFPGLDADASYRLQRRSENLIDDLPGASAGGDNPSDLFALGFDAAWEIDLFGRVRRSVEAADAGLDAAHADRRDVLVTILAEVARNYVELRSAQRRIAIAQANIDAQRSSLDLARARFEAGLTSELDVAQARSNLASTISQLPLLETAARRAAHRLAVLLGDEPGALLDELTSPAPVPAAAGAVPVGLPSDLLRRRPDIRRAERNLAAATARIGVATADLFPRVSLTGTLGLQAGSLDNLFESGSHVYSIGPVARWNLFDAGRNRARIRVQEARQEQALIQYDTTVLAAFEETENALVAYAQEQLRRRALADAVEASQRSVELAEALYREGLRDFQTVLDAQRFLYSLEDQFADSDARVTTNLIALYKALGGGWESIDPEG